MKSSEKAADEVRLWLSEWAEAIRTKDFAKGEALFLSTTSGFGTVTLRTDGLEDLVLRQWREVWTRTREFQFDENTMSILISLDETQACVHCLWRSLSDEPTDSGRMRTGRATILLTRTAPTTPWRGVHTHFSMWPDMADLEI